MERVIKVAVVGIGAMGRGHVENYKRFARENKPIELVAVCDIDEQKLSGEKATALNLSDVADVGREDVGYSMYRQYTSYEEMFKKEKDLDYVDIVLPTYLHSEVSIKAMKAGFNVFCEKPMARNEKECAAMIATAERTGKKLMLGQCLRFWGEYEFIKNCVQDGRYGKCVCATFFRGGATPQGSYNDWLLKGDLGGGGLHDQHVHDADFVNYLFGLPEAVSTSGATLIPGSGYDCCSTNYYYPDGKVINTMNDWTINGNGYGFHFEYRVNFEKAVAVLKDNVLTVYPVEGEAFTPEFDKENAYYKELLYFAGCVRNDVPVEMSTPASCADTVKLVCAEAKSAAKGGKLISVK